MRKADNLPPYFAVVKKSRTLNFLDPSGPAWPITGVLYLLPFDFTPGHCGYLHLHKRMPVENLKVGQERFRAPIFSSRHSFVIKFHATEPKLKTSLNKLYTHKQMVKPRRTHIYLAPPTSAHIHTHMLATSFTIKLKKDMI